MTAPEGGRTMLLTCYRDIRPYGWPHVDLFLHDPDGRELNWVHWAAAEEGPEGADAACAAVEPRLRRTTPWRHGVRADGSDYWTAHAEWNEQPDRTDSQEEAE
ncbi:hypothetical protein [Streptomyces sp. RTd22]|uniref:hypothetical protein n=1 Tax=Streptomyces sp. RTd22 TaxID=1841249 RepID=UPI0007C5B937|nr:hypothetical protein [Streptomyces sp. RTd22]